MSCRQSSWCRRRRSGRRPDDRSAIQGSLRARSARRRGHPRLSSRMDHLDRDRRSGGRPRPILQHFGAPDGAHGARTERRHQAARTQVLELRVGSADLRMVRRQARGRGWLTLVSSEGQHHVARVPGPCTIESHDPLHCCRRPLRPCASRDPRRLAAGPGARADPLHAALPGATHALRRSGGGRSRRRDAPRSRSTWRRGRRART